MFYYNFIRVYVLEFKVMFVYSWYLKNIYYNELMYDQMNE